MGASFGRFRLCPASARQAGLIGFDLVGVEASEMGSADREVELSRGAGEEGAAEDSMWRRAVSTPEPA